VTPTVKLDTQQARTALTLRQIRRITEQQFIAACQDAGLDDKVSSFTKRLRRGGNLI
jgi:hypothetical protein